MWHSWAVDRVTEGARRSQRRATDPSSGSASDTRDRYRPKTRRASAEPLRASWEPLAQARERERGKKKRRSRLRRIVGAFGWRVYAVPILLVLTAMVVLDTTRDTGESGGALLQDTPSSDSAARDQEPAASENPAGQVDLDIPTAKLPKGGDYTQEGKGTWHVVPGGGEKVGRDGRLFTYTVEIEDGIDPASYAGDDSFAAAVEGTLSDPRSWTGTGEVSLRRVDASFPNPDFRVSLTTPGTVRKPEICGSAIPYEASCYRRDVQGENRVVINLARWVRGALAFSFEMTGYRQYAVNHEVGHALGLGHKGCERDGALAPVMMQQTFGVANDYVAKLNDIPGGDQGAVPADGKVCKPNAWPNPKAERN